MLLSVSRALPELFLDVERFLDLLVHFLEVLTEGATELPVVLIRHHHLAVAVEQKEQFVALVTLMEDPLAFLDVGPARRLDNLMHCVLI